MKNNYLSKLEFWNKLKVKEQEELIKNSVIKEYKKGSIIHSENNECLGMMVITQGQIRTCIVSEEGREITLFKLSENDVCVLSADCVIKQITFDTLMIAETDCKILLINVIYFNQLINQNIYARCYTYELISEKFSNVMWVMKEILFDKFDKRLASFLIKETQKNNNLKIKVTQEQIAKDLNTAREVVSRMLKRFELDEIIEIQRGGVKILNLEKLKELSY